MSFSKFLTLPTYINFEEIVALGNGIFIQYKTQAHK